MSAAQPSPLPVESGRVAARPDSDPLSLVLPIGHPGEGPALFCLLPATGLSREYVGLADYLPGRAVYGLQTLTSEGIHQEGGGIAQLADALLHPLRQLQPEGPYHLLGWSFGGLVAHAVATRLQLQGCPIGLLAVLDGYPHGPAGTPDALRLLDLGEWARGRQLRAALRRSYQLRRGYLPQRFLGELTLVVATGDGHSGLDRALQWQHHAAAVQFHEVPCAHQELLGPQALRTVGPLVAARLAGAGRAPSRAVGSCGGDGA